MVVSPCRTEVPGLGAPGGAPDPPASGLHAGQAQQLRDVPDLLVPERAGDEAPPDVPVEDEAQLGAGQLRVAVLADLDDEALRPELLDGGRLGALDLVEPGDAGGRDDGLDRGGSADRDVDDHALAGGALAGRVVRLGLVQLRVADPAALDLLADLRLPGVQLSLVLEAGALDGDGLEALVRVVAVDV